LLSPARRPLRLFNADMKHSRYFCGGDVKIIAASLEWPVIETSLAHLGLDP
jgi:hypothetical protein